MIQDDLIKEYTPLVRIIAAKYRNNRVQFDDLIQEGLLGILEAQKRFDPKREIKFSTYAGYWIRKKILEALSREYKTSLNAVNLDVEDLEPLAQVPPDIARHPTQSIQLPPDLPAIEAQILKFFFEEHKSLREIAEILNLSREKVRQLQQLALRRIRLNPKLTQYLSGLNPKNV